ncbi:MAG TPA: hypothetical protein VFD43_05875, partial [Planctomycetota bacterium]|nr:hypothetical protein [Planctomycetota bacterium]
MMPASPRWNRIAFVIAAACAAGLLAFSVRRAVSFPFTHDESLSFTMLDWPARMRDKASNHHLLNTLAMRAGRALFGVEPWSLRLGSLAAHAVYLGAALAFVRRLRSPVVGLCAFGLLALNPFVLDFFFLARGYGPASAFLLLGLLCLVCAQHDARRIGGRPAALVFLAATCAALSALANLAFLHASVPLLAGCAWVLLNGASLRPIERRRIPPLLALVAGAGLFAAAILPRILEMQRIGQLYFGGRSGLVADTLGSLVASSMYDRRLADPARELLAWSLLAVPALLGLAVLGVRASGQEGAPRSGLLLALLSGALAMPVLQHALFGTNYPIERAALYLVPLWSLAVASALDVLAAPAARPGSRRAALAFAGTLLA